MFVHQLSVMLEKFEADAYQVVEESSAAPTIENTIRAGLPCDHKNMCKFSSRNSSAYEIIAAALVRYSEEAPKVIPQRWTYAIDMLQTLRIREARKLIEPFRSL